MFPRPSRPIKGVPELGSGEGKPRPERDRHEEGARSLARWGFSRVLPGLKDVPGKPLPARGVPVAVEKAAGSPGSLSLPLPGAARAVGGLGLASAGRSARGRPARKSGRRCGP